MKTCPSCGRTSNKSEYFCDACGGPLFAGTGLGTGGSIPQDPPAPPASGQPYPTPGFPPQGFPPQGYPPTTGYGTSAPRRRKKKLSGRIGMIVAVCIVLAVGAIAVYILTLPKIKVTPPQGWIRATSDVKKNFEEGMGGGSLDELFVPQNGAPAFIAVGRVKPGSLKDLPDTQDLAVMQEYVSNNQDNIDGEFAKEGMDLNGVEARQLACGQSAVLLVSLGMSVEWHPGGNGCHPDQERTRRCSS